MNEKLIEKKLVETVRKHGGLAPKFVSPGLDGVPDRIILLPGGCMAFAELKSPGKKLRRLQVRRKEQLECLGFRVFCIDGTEQIEEVIDEMVEELQRRHMLRMTENRCDVFNGTYFQNILLNLERVSDQCSDLAVYLLARHDDTISGREHQYLHNLHHSNNTNYKQAFKTFYKKYFDQLKEIPES